ncbi:MAG: glycine--tRNA ligase subunit beta [Legionellaceae bacterium]|nr:glycine--tRNA ligase subunit beta [Legionellaceae bacterium]
MSQDFLFELGTEELPSGSVFPLAEALAERITAGLAKARLMHGMVQAFSTPRRLAVLIHDVQLEQASHATERLGPREEAGLQADGTPSKALLGFARSCQVAVDALVVIDTLKGRRFAFQAMTAAVPTIQLLPDIIHDAVMGLPIPKPMRWGSGSQAFVRPVHWAILLFGKEVVKLELLGCETNNFSFGHRYHHPESIQINQPKDYEVRLRDASVMVDFKARRDAITASVLEALLPIDAEAVMPEALLDEVASIVEWPTALLVKFESKFLDIPSEVLIESMQSHQKCFAVRDKQGALLPYFVTVSNIQSTSPDHVIKGNETVMKARLSDAEFFFAEDQKQSLHDRVKATENVVFQAKLGSLRDKTARIEAIMSHLIEPLSLDAADASRAALLCKCDLLTGMVGEFPELQGTMGYYYAQIDAETPAVAVALQEQYLPRFSSDALPKSSLSIALSLADRIDTLVGTFAIGLKPTGESDPFKLRRHALAIVRLLGALPVSVGLGSLLNAARCAYGTRFLSDEELLPAVQTFILGRLPAYYHTASNAAELVQAALAKQSDCLRDLDARIVALESFMQQPDAKILAAACKRVNKLLKHVSATQGDIHPVDEALFQDAPERALFIRITQLEAVVSELYANALYGDILVELTSLREPVDAFFEHVMVMVEDADIKANRLRLLARLQALLQCVADMSLLPQVL